MRTGSANANNAEDHIAVLDLALAQLPADRRGRVLVRADSGGGTKAFLARITDLGWEYSVAIGTVIGVTAELLALIAKPTWEPAYDSCGQPRDGAQVAELTKLLPDLTKRGWQTGMRVIAPGNEPTPVRSSA